MSLPSIGENTEAGDEVWDGTTEGAFLDSFFFRSADPVKEYTSESINKSVMSSLLMLQKDNKSQFSLIIYFSLLAHNTSTKFNLRLAKT
jgi:hypothetical protein